jgi:asparagine synthase (glutamine-hydrolysing)
VFHADVEGHSEYDAACVLSKHLKLDLKKVRTSDQDTIDLTPRIIYHYEWPYAWNPHSVPFYMVSQLVREHGVKAVLTGEGADESFLGYPYYAQQPFWDAYEAALRSLRRLVHRIPRLGRQLWPVEGEYALVIGSALKQFEALQEHGTGHHRTDSRRIRAIYSDRMQRAADRNVTTIEELSGHLRTLLHRNDRMGMAASIEARFPFLDESLVREVINLPRRYKLRPSITTLDRSHPFIRDKWALRELANRYLPRELSQRKKRGFDVSALTRVAVQRSYFRNSYTREFMQMTEEEFDYFYDALDQKTLVKLMMLEVWGQIFIQNVSIEAAQERLKAHASFRAEPSRRHIGSMLPRGV